MLALTVLQPWASALVLGHKDVENRTWCSVAGLPPGTWLAIHAGRCDADVLQVERAVLDTLPGQPRTTASLPKCTFLGAVRIEGYGRWLRRKARPGEHPCRMLADSATCDLRPSCSQWANGPVCWAVDRAVALPAPKPSWSQRGRLGLWPCPAGVEAEILAEIVRKYGELSVAVPRAGAAR